MLKNKYDAEIERMMNEDGLTHSEAMKAYEKKHKEKNGDDEEDEAEGSDKAMRLPASLFPEGAEGKEVNFSVTGTLEAADGEMVTIKCKNLHIDIHEPYKDPKPTPEVAR